MDRGIPDDVAEAVLLKVYRRRVEDPVGQLADLRLLRSLDPDAGSYRPRPFPTAELAACRASLSSLRDAPKEVFRRGSAAEIRDLLEAE